MEVYLTKRKDGLLSQIRYTAPQYSNPTKPLKILLSSKLQVSITIQKLQMFHVICKHSTIPLLSHVCISITALNVDVLDQNHQTGTIYLQRHAVLFFIVDTNCASTERNPMEDDLI